MALCNCGKRTASTSGICGRCIQSRMAVDNPIDKSLCHLCFEKPAQKDGYCDSCRCSSCKALSQLRILDEKLFCLECLFKLHPDLFCKVCKSGEPEIFRKGDKKPRLCASCAQTTVHYCTFCNEKAVAWNQYYVLVCKTHREKGYCKSKDCHPDKVCARCEEAVKKYANKKKRDERYYLQEETALFSDPNKIIQDQHLQYSVGGCLPECPVCMVADPRRVYLNNAVFFMPKPTLKDTKDVDIRRYCGIELEVANFQHNLGFFPRIAARKWNAAIVRDGSIPHGFEIKTSPATGQTLKNQIYDMCEALSRCNAIINKTCGLHVHVDARDHSYNEIRKLLLYWALLEPVLIRTQPYERIFIGFGGKRFCFPCGEAYISGLVTPPKTQHELKEILLKNIYRGARINPEEPHDVPHRAPRVPLFGIDLKPPRTSHHGIDARYRAFNIHSWFERGTVECRIHEGTISPLQVYWWTSIIANLVERAYGMTEKEVLGVERRALDEVISLAPDENARSYITERIRKYGKDFDKMKVPSAVHLDDLKRETER